MTATFKVATIAALLSILGGLGAGTMNTVRGAAAKNTSTSTLALVTVNVRDFGARGNGTHDDTGALREAMAAAAAKGGGTVHVPEGDYLLTAITVPDSVHLTGDGSRVSWLHGAVTAGSHVELQDLKIGTRGRAFKNTAGAHDSVFTRCRFRGGGANSYVILLGDQKRSVDHFTFRDCDVECNLGTANADHSNDVNNIRITENAAPGGAHVDSITFVGCHIGVFNGVRKGSPRADLEAYTWDSSGTIAHGWSNLVIRDCVFEAADEFTIDLADANRVSAVHSGPALISGNLIKGGGKSRHARWGYGICIERPNGVVIENNTMYRASNNTIGTAIGHLNDADTGPIIRNNIFDMNHPNGITTHAPYFLLRGSNVEFAGNTVKARRGTLFAIEDARNVNVSGNALLGSARLFAIGPRITNVVTSPNTVN